MSNHSGGYMLNNVLEIAKDMEILDTIGKERTYEFVMSLIKLGRHYDCNDFEILEDIGQELGICYHCLKENEELECGICPKCKEELTR